MHKKTNFIIFLVLLTICFSLLIFADSVTSGTSGTPAWEASESLKQSKNAINYMQNLELNTERVNELLEDGKISEKLGDYDRVVEIGNKIKKLKET